MSEETVTKTDFVDYKSEMRNTIDKIELKIDNMSTNINKLAQNQTELQCSINTMDNIVKNTCDSISTFQTSLTKFNNDISQLDFERLKNRDKEVKKEKITIAGIVAIITFLSPPLLRILGSFLVGAGK